MPLHPPPPPTACFHAGGAARRLPTSTSNPNTLEALLLRNMVREGGAGGLAGSQYRGRVAPGAACLPVRRLGTWLRAIFPRQPSDLCPPPPPFVRSQLCMADFAQCVQNVPPGSGPTVAAATLGKYYPRTTWCAKALFAQGKTAADGAKLCFAAAGA